MEIKFIEARIYFDARYHAPQPVFTHVELGALCDRPSYLPDVRDLNAENRCLRAMLRRLPSAPIPWDPDAHDRMSLGASGSATDTDSLPTGMTGSFQTLRHAIASGYTKVWS